MDIYTLSSLVITVAVIIGYLNHRFVHMQTTIAIMVGAMGLSLIIIILQHLGFTEISERTTHMISRTNFHDLLLKGMLGFLLFAGALTIDLRALKAQMWEIGTLATVSTIASTLLIGFLSYYLLPFLGLKVPLLYCLLFGALISPTDPIAVLATFKELGAPKRLEVCVAGESLFNDGVGIVLFTTFYELAFNHAQITFGNVSILFLKQAIGGLAYGLLLGLLTNYLIKKVKDHKIALLLTLGAVSGGYSFALWLDISGPLAMVVSGIYIGHELRKSKNRSLTNTLEIFWELIDEILNAILFLLIGLEMLVLHAKGIEYLAAALAIPFALIIRLVTVAVPMKFLRFKRDHGPYMISILTWGGLRGGLAVALSLAIPASPYRNVILTMTYAIVAFAIIVQGLTIKRLAVMVEDKKSA